MKACVETASWYADLIYQGEHICRVSLCARLDPHAARWALDSKACDFIDEWSTRSFRRDSGIGELLL